MVIPPAELSIVGAYGSGSGVPDDETADRAIQDQLQRFAIIMDWLMATVPTLGQPTDDDLQRYTIIMEWMRSAAHPLGQLADDELHHLLRFIYVTRLRGVNSFVACSLILQRMVYIIESGPRGVNPPWQPADDVGEEISADRLDRLLGTHTTGIPTTFEYEMSRDAARRREPVLTQRLLQSYSVGPLGTRAPSQDGFPGHLAPVVTDGDGEALYSGGGADSVTGPFPVRDGETPYSGAPPHLPRGARIPSVGDGDGANAGNQHVIDMPPLPNGTTGTTDQARKFLERLLFGLLPACVVALVPLSGAPDGTKLATFIIMAVLIVLLVVGISTRACAEHVVRLAVCAGIFAMTVLVSIQFSHGIYVAVAALVGVALSAITLAV